jgi:Domain of unknown function (DUF4292)
MKVFQNQIVFGITYSLKEKKTTMKFIVLFIPVTIFLFSCKAKQGLAIEKGVSNPKLCKSTELILKANKQNTIDYQWFTAKAKVDYQGPPEAATFQVNLRMKKDSIIWATFSKFGFEGVRVRISPSGIEILNRLNNTFLKKDFSYLKEQFNISLTFTQLQNVLVGNLIGFDKDANMSVSSEDCCCNLVASDGYEASKAVFDMQTLLLKHLNGNVQAGTYDFFFDEYAQIEKRKFSTKRDVKIHTSKGQQIAAVLDYSDIVFDIEKSTNFEIPEHYQKL